MGPGPGRAKSKMRVRRVRVGGVQVARCDIYMDKQCYQQHELYGYVQVIPLCASACTEFCKVANWFWSKDTLVLLHYIHFKVNTLESII